MSIDARVTEVVLNNDGTGYLELGQRPGSSSSPGQLRLNFQHAPEEVCSLKGRDIWGDSSKIMLGDHEIARRTTYVEILFCDCVTFIRALNAKKR